MGPGTGRPARPRTARPGASRPDLSHSQVREAAVLSPLPPLPPLPDRPPENATPDERVDFYRRAALRLDVDFHLACFRHTDAERNAFLALRAEAERVERRGRSVPKPLRREYFRLIDAVVHRRILEERASRPAVDAAVWTPIDQTKPVGHQGWASERAGRATVPAVPPVESADDEDAEALAA